MPRPLRDRNPARYWLVTMRTENARLWICPTSRVRKLVGGIIARYQELLGVEIYAYSVLGNHFHILLRAPLGNLDEFCENVNREMARRLNWLHSRRGRFWARRYDALDVLSEEDLLEAFLYVTTNPSRHGLVRDSREWPGLHCFEHALKEVDQSFSFTCHSAPPGPQRRTSHKLRLSVLPQLRVFSRKKRKKVLRRYLLERLEYIAAERESNDEGFLGLSAVKDQEPGLIPRNVSHSTRPCCYTRCSELRERFRAVLRERRLHYDHASQLYRLGRSDVTFPSFSFKPPLHRVPRLIPFAPLDRRIEQEQRD